MPQLNQITPAQLARLIGLPDAPAMIDVRLPEDFALDPRLIPGSSRIAHDLCDPAPARLQARRVVVVCAKGRKLTKGGAALLRTQGIAVEVLWPADRLPRPRLACRWFRRTPCPAICG